MINSNKKRSELVNQNKKTQKNNQNLTKDIDTISEKFEEYHKRDLNKITELLRNAKNEICILGLVGYGPIHESPNEIINLIIEHNGIVKILIGNPHSKYFKNRMKREKDEQKSSLHQYNASIAEIERIFNQLPTEKQNNIIVKEYNNLNGDFSLQIIDKQEMYVNVRIDREGLRCFDSPMFKVYRKRLAQQLTFEHYIKIFEDVWNDNDTKEVSIGKNRWEKDLIDGTDIKIETLSKVLIIAEEIGEEGREGNSVGTAFVIGDAKQVLEKSRQINLNPYEGHKPESRMVTNPNQKESIKEFAQMDGAFVITGDGFIEAAGRYITVETSDVALPKGMGTRHNSVAAVTKITPSVGIVVSQSGGKISVFKNGKLERRIRNIKIDPDEYS
jgi:DNA integrity scanning protein DisA with diadenylate cyclase activity